MALLAFSKLTVGIPESGALIRGLRAGLRGDHGHALLFVSGEAMVSRGGSSPMPDGMSPDEKQRRQKQGRRCSRRGVLPAFSPLTLRKRGGYCREGVSN